MPALFETLWNEPRAPGATGPLRKDWVLVGVIVLANLAEGFLSDGMTWRPLSVAVSSALALTLPWRRVHPLAAVLLAFGSTAVVQSAALVRGVDWAGMDTSLFLLILPYALLRWGSGREAIAGLAMIAVAFAVAVPGTQGWAEGIGAGFFLLFPAAVGASVRYRDSAQRRAAEQVRLRERERLARELHDTVAHHVSAIAVQAQAGQAVAATRPDAPLEILAVIEEAASRTLAEMRHIVGALREEGDDGEMAPAHGKTLADIERLAREDMSGRRVDIVFTGALDDLDATLGTTLYRLVREGLTNAARHARGARGVSVHVTGEAMQVHLRIVDDGEVAVSDADAVVAAGYGLRGMAERVTLLGGTLRAGPGHPRGWAVDVTLPKRGGSL